MLVHIKAGAKTRATTSALQMLNPNETNVLITKDTEIFAKLKSDIFGGNELAKSISVLFPGLTTGFEQLQSYIDNMLSQRDVGGVVIDDIGALFPDREDQHVITDLCQISSWNYPHKKIIIVQHTSRPVNVDVYMRTGDAQ